MKFEMPIAEIEKFDLEDIISTSGGQEGPTTEHTAAAEEGRPCLGSASDENDQEPCIL